MKQPIQELIMLARNEKRSAQNAIMNFLWNKVYGYVLFRIHQEEEAEDITIETFTKVFNKLDLYNSDFDFTTWVLSIAHNTMIDHIRKTTAPNVSLDDEWNVLQISDIEPTPEEILINIQNNEELRNDINRLKPKYKKVLELRYLEDKSYQEIADELQISLTNVKVQLLRAKKLLMEIMHNKS